MVITQFEEKKKPRSAGLFVEASADYLVPMTSMSTRRSGCRQSISALDLAVALALVARNRLLLALAFGVNTVGFDTLGNQVFLHSGSALFGKLLVVGITTDAVGMTDEPG
jgi:hypothetical protein